ncbi:MAG TPA: dethiobiotin synthase [Solirubrobacteraceae bacterium]|jgi:dethiobiotin synthetase
MPGLFVTGTDTGAGKTVVAAAIVAALRARGRTVRASKPVITGLDEPAGCWPHDHELLARAAGSRPEEVALVGYGPAVSPHLAAELASRPLDPAELVRDILAGGEEGELLIVEGAGGLLVPLAADYDMRALAQDLGLGVVIATRPTLGTINHTLLTLEAARAAGLEVVGVVMTPWRSDPSVMELSNRTSIAHRGEIEVSALPEIERPEPELLATAGMELPLSNWLPVPVAR